MSESDEANINREPPSPRIWPAVVIVIAMWTAKKGTEWFATGTMLQFMAGYLGPMIALALFVLWWLFASRLAWRERLIGFAIGGSLVGASIFFAHPKTRFVWLFQFGPWMLLAIVAVLLLGAAISWRKRRWLPVAVIAATAAIGLALRFEGADGSFNTDFSPRWSPTREEVFLSKQQSIPLTTGLELALEPSATDWPEFRGAARDGRISGVTFQTDWNASPPQELWRREIGPGWGSFTVIGETVFTQEQRGPQEVVVAYTAQSGEPVWLNQVESRFDETIGGPGPRATPTYHQGKLYTQGASGKVQCLDATTGETIWVRDLTVDTPAKPPIWGFSSSPLVINDLVVTYSGAGEGKSVVAYDRTNGQIAWTAGDSTHSYSSPQLASLSNVEQVLMLSNGGLCAFSPKDGEQLWQHDWDLGPEMNRVIQPLVLGNDVLIGTFYGKGTQRISVSNGEDGSWKTTEVWTSRKMKPYFNDFVEHDGFLYGFDGKIFACINLEDGMLAWKRGRYGHGQVLLVADMGMLLILGEKGELVLLEANPKKHIEVAEIQAVEGKTWNHPVISGSRLFVRNGNEAVCYELTPSEPTEVAALDSTHSTNDPQ